MLCLLELHYCGVLSNQAFAQCSGYPSYTRKPFASSIPLRSLFSADGFNTSTLNE